ncbi:MAG: alpha/beta fold hydrolase [Verrucomicrobia bacterium]|nr:alpha/beta fold hydrolase [Verrucomicrobiota bacterium]
MKSAISLVLGFVLATTSCKSYSTVTQVQPAYRSPSPAGQIIATSLKQASPQPLVRMGHFLDAAAAAGSVLEKHPDNTQARLDYNFAVARIFGIINDAGLEPWKAPLRCPGASQSWKFSLKRDPQPQRNPSHFKIEPADIYNFKGTLVVQRTVKDGLGAPLVVMSKDIDPEKLDPFAQGKHIYYGMTGVVNFKGRDCVAQFVDPLAVETVPFGGHTYPLAADFTAPLALALADLKPRKTELAGLFKPEEFESKIRLARLQPYDPNKIPILCIHGLGDSQATWAPLIQTLRGDPVIRKNYQFWFFSYPTGYPYPLTAAALRKRMDKINAYYPNHKKIVVIGHSMGGMISRTLITDSGMTLWNAIYDKPPAQMPFSAGTRQVMSDSLIFKHRTDVSRVIFASPSHRGSYDATNFWGRLGSKIIGAPTDIMRNASEALTLAKPNSTGKQIQQMPNSIDMLNPGNRFVTTMAKIPLTPGIPYHTILGDRGKGGNLSHEPPVSTDGIVPYWSSHLDGAKSELIIPSDHWTHRHPLGIAEVGRILHEHLKGTAL